MKLVLILLIACAAVHSSTAQDDKNARLFDETNSDDNDVDAPEGKDGAPEGKDDAPEGKGDASEGKGDAPEGKDEIPAADETGPPGHLKPLGENLEVVMTIEVREDLPSPVELWDKYVKASKPVLLRGAAKTFPNFDKLRDDKYLR